jgi:hypothetical protein
MKVLNSQLSVQAMQLRAGAQGFAVEVQLACIDEVMESQLGVLDSFSGRTRISDGQVFGARERLFGGDGAVVKATMLTSAVAPASAEVVRLGGEAVTQGSGIMFARVGAAEAEQAVARLRELVEEGASVTVLRGEDGLGVLPKIVSAAALMRQIKRRFDAKGTLNPGVVVGA